MIKDREHFIFTQPLKFYGTHIKLDLKGIILIKKVYIGGIILVTDHNANSTSS